MNCYVLCGGKSSRIGRPKQGLELAGETFLQRANRAASAVFDSVIAVTKAGREAEGMAVIHEAETDITAPILGLARAAEHAGDNAFFALAVDYPLMTAELLSYLRQRFEASEAEIVAPRSSGKVHVLCAAYRPSVHTSLADKIRRQDYRLQGLLDLHRAEIVEPGELERFGDVLLNVNTPEDLERAQAGHGKTIQA